MVAFSMIPHRFMSNHYPKLVWAQISEFVPTKQSHLMVRMRILLNIYGILVILRVL